MIPLISYRDLRSLASLNGWDSLLPIRVCGDDTVVDNVIEAIASLW